MKTSRTENMNKLREPAEFDTLEEYYDYVVAMSG